MVARFLGGRGLGAALLFRHLANPADPFAPGNPLIFAVGPLTGTPWPTGSRCHVTFHSPLTSIYGYANAGGFFGAALRRAGYDVLVITGRAEQPVYLEVTPEEIALRPAGHLWGLGIRATHETLATRSARRLHRAGRGKRCAFRRDYQRRRPGGGSLRWRRGDGQQEPQGHRRSRTRKADPASRFPRQGPARLRACARPSQCHRSA